MILPNQPLPQTKEEREELLRKIESLNLDREEVDQD